MATQEKFVKRICLYHMRKAGGTSLRHYVEALSNQKGMVWNVVEGFSLDHHEYFSHSDSTLYIISIREPISRIKSSYLYEGRWRPGENQRRVEYAKSFPKWIQEINNLPRSSKIWYCVSNYYIKTLIGYPQRGSEKISIEELEFAKKILQRFDIVLITEWMNNKKTTDYLRHQLDFDKILPKLRRPTKVQSPVEQERDLFDEATLDKIRENNQWDTRLYQFAQELVAQRMAYAQSHPYRKYVFSPQDSGRIIDKAVMGTIDEDHTSSEPGPVAVQIHLTGDHQHRVNLPSNSPILRNLFAALGPDSQSPATDVPALFQIPLHGGRAALSFARERLLAVVTEPTGGLPTTDTAITPESNGMQPTSHPLPHETPV